MPDYSGYWTGRTEGTNEAGITFEITQDSDNISGIAKVYEHNVGVYEFTFKGKASIPLILTMYPTQKSKNIGIGTANVTCSLDAQGVLFGKWKTSIGTAGTFRARKDSNISELDQQKDKPIFIVHGHDDGSKEAVARFLERQGIRPIILHEQLNRGKTIIEKFEEHASKVGFAIILMTPDDMGYQVGKEDEKQFRARQNVILELGYFTARLGRSEIFVLRKGIIELPSDIFGIIYEEMDEGGAWKLRLAGELKAAGYKVDMNLAI